MRTLAAVLLGGLATLEAGAGNLLNEADTQYLSDLTAAVVEASRVPVGGTVGSVGPNTTGGTLIRPGGRDCYPAFWIRDYAMSLDSGFITPQEQRHALMLTAACQPDESRDLKSGSVIPAGSIADHITFSGKPIFYPGVLDDYEGQGGAQWGKWPCYDDHFYFVHMATHYVDTTGDADVLNEAVNGKPLIHRLQEAFAAPPSRPDTHLVYAESEARGVNFGFFDTVVHTGDLLFASVLKAEAAKELAGLLQRTGDLSGAERYRSIAQAIQRAIPPAFVLKSGLLRASTGKSAQPDVWGTAYAVYAGVLDGPTEQAAREALTQACRAGTITWQGMVRHVPTDSDFSPTTAWEVAYAPLNTYQNGAYWGTATGWLCYAVAQVDRDLAVRLASEYVAHLRKEDYRQGAEFGAPWECLHAQGNHRQNPVYMASVTCPLAAFRRL